MTKEELEAIAEEDIEGKPDLAVLLERAMLGASERMKAVSLGIASSPSETAGTVSSRPAISRAGAEEDEPIIPDVPLLQLAGAKGGLYIPPSASDTTLMLHSDRSIDEWSQGDGKTVVRPADKRSHDPGDAVALPVSKGGAPTGAAGAVCLHGSDVRLGSGAAVDYLVKGTAFKAALNALPTLVSNPACPEVAVWANALLAVLKAMALSTKVKVD